MAAHITLLVVGVAALALFVPMSFSWIATSAVTPMLGVVMFGMGLTLNPADFKPVLMHPKDILVGELAQFLVWDQAVAGSSPVTPTKVHQFTKLMDFSFFVINPFP